MSDTQPIYEAAEQLGRLIADHPAAQKLDGLVKQLDDDLEAQRLMTDLNRHTHSLGEKETQGQPIEVEEKHKLKELQQAVALHPTLRELQMAQMDYVDLMRGVEQRIGGRS